MEFMILMNFDARVFHGITPMIHLIFYKISEATDEDGRPRRHSPRGRQEKHPSTCSYFGKILEQAEVNSQTNGSVWDEDHRHGKAFRRSTVSPM
jgi:hypothetical protein